MFLLYRMIPEKKTFITAASASCQLMHRHSAAGPVGWRKGGGGVFIIQNAYPSIEVLMLLQSLRDEDFATQKALTQVRTWCGGAEIPHSNAPSTMYTNVPSTACASGIWSIENMHIPGARCRFHATLSSSRDKVANSCSGNVGSEYFNFSKVALTASMISFAM